MRERCLRLLPQALLFFTGLADPLGFLPKAGRQMCEKQYHYKREIGIESNMCYNYLRLPAYAPAMRPQGGIYMNARDVYENWLKKLDRSNPLYAELEAIKDNETEITERFYREIEFGTAGLRGICGAGTNRMNELTVGRATQGIANYINKSGEDASRGVAIAYDCRHFSKEFSELAAEILAGNGIRAYIFPSLRPTPELSYAVRKLNAVAGINMTASHNPKEYNGYKVYWADGAQISGKVSDGMLAEIQALDMFDEFKRVPLKDAVAGGMVVMLGEDCLKYNQYNYYLNHSLSNK